MAEVVLQDADAFDELTGLPTDYGDVAVVDFPWEFVNQDRPGRASHENAEDWEMADNSLLPSVLEELSRVVRRGGYVFVFADDDVYPEFRSAVESELTFRKTLIWDCERMGNGHYFRNSHTPFLCATVGETDRYIQATETVFQHPAPQREPGETTEYPTEKPASLYRGFLEPAAERGERILEPFCGTAPALEVAKSLGCDYWGCDVSPDALKHARRRQGQAAVGDF